MYVVNYKFIIYNDPSSKDINSRVGNLRLIECGSGRVGRRELQGFHNKK